MTFQTTITEVCSYIGDNWMIDPHPPQELLEGYFHLISKEYENQHFSMYGFIMNETLYIKGCVFNELNGDAYFHERRSLNNFHRDRVITFEQIAE